MITLEEIEKQLQELKSIKKPIGKLTKEYKGAQKRFEFLKNCKLYLESNPSEDFVIKQMNECKKLKQRLAEAYPEWARNFKPQEHIKNIKTYYNKEMGIVKIQNQLKYLSFIAKAS